MNLIELKGIRLTSGPLKIYDNPPNMSINSGRVTELPNEIMRTLINDKRMGKVLPVSRNFH